MSSMIAANVTSETWDRIIRTMGSIGLSVFIVVRRCAGLKRCREISYPATRTTTGIPVGSCFDRFFSTTPAL